MTKKSLKKFTTVFPWFEPTGNYPEIKEMVNAFLNLRDTHNGKTRVFNMYGKSITLADDFRNMTAEEYGELKKIEESNAIESVCNFAWRDNLENKKLHVTNEGEPHELVDVEDNLEVYNHNKHTWEPVWTQRQ